MGIQFDPSKLRDTPTIACDFKKGDEVVFTNDYGVVFEGFTIIGFAQEEDVFNERFIHIDSDAPWFPTRVEQLEHKSEYEKKQAYIKNGGKACFKCGSNFLLKCTPENKEGKITQIVTCGNCKYSWIDSYTLSQINE
jgi:hypothetical protein